MMLQLRCMPVAEAACGTNEREFVLELADDPERLLLTLNLCRLLMPPDTAPLHLENWRQLEALVRQLSKIYRQAWPRAGSCRTHHPAQRLRANRQRPKN